MALTLALSAPLSSLSPSSTVLASERAHQITALELQRAHHRRRHRDVQGHALVLASCYRKIKRVAAVDSTSCIYEVPEFVIGAPPFDLSTAVSYVISSLERNGYTVSYMFPRALLISWDLEGSRNVATSRQAQTQLPSRESRESSSHPPSAPAAVAPPFPPHPQMTVPMLDFDLQMPPLIPQMAPRTTTFKPIAEFKPSGRFVMRL